MYDGLSEQARALIAEAREDIGPDGPTDHHLHVAGFDSEDSVSPGVWVHPDYRSWAHPYRRFVGTALLRTCGVKTSGDANTQYLQRLLELVLQSGLGGSYMLYALDWRYERPPNNREPNRDKTDLYVSNTYVIEAAHRLNAAAAGSARFIPVASVHPWRQDAIDTIAMLAEGGIRYLKWLPPAQNIDPADPSLTPFYRALQRSGIVLLSHTGNEHTLRVNRSDQDLANPTRLARALDEGVTVVMLHAGRDGAEIGLGADGLRAPFAQRFVEMMRRYPSGLFGEISAVPYLGTQALLERFAGDPDIRMRLVNGSDYPLPAIPCTDPTRALFRAGYLSDAEDDGPGDGKNRARALREIRRFNPLLFDFVLKRTLRIKGQRLPASIFRSGVVSGQNGSTLTDF